MNHLEQVKEQNQKCVYITLGCKVNQYDTQAIREHLETANIQETKDFREANFLLINSCTVTEKADQKTQRYINQFARRSPQGQIIVTGCSVDNLYKKYKADPRVNYVIRNRDKKSIAAQVTQGNADIKPFQIKRFDGHTRAFLKIQDGCQETCSFCIIPRVRGRFDSREEEDIVAEAKDLVTTGYREIVLTGIHLGGYGVDKPVSLTRLIRKLTQIDELQRLRLSSIEVNEITEEMIELLQTEEKFCPHLHLPLQSGDNTILEQMRRKYSREQFIEKALECRAKIPEIGLTTDIIVGFPGETEEQFQNTIALCRQVGFSKIHIFPYSDRRGTRAAQMSEKCEKKTIKRRCKELEKVEHELIMQERKPYIGKIMKVLGEEETLEKETIGYTKNYFRVKFPGTGLKNKLIPVEIKEIGGKEIYGIQVLR